jgi:trans-aconitate 2-methyltransferase
LLLADVVGSTRCARLGPLLRSAPVAPAADFFALLAPDAQTVDVWTTEYLHVLPAAGDGEHPVVAWTRGTALTPFLRALGDAEQRAFLGDYAERIAQAYPLLDDGRVLFAFRRLFLVATRRDDGRPASG